MNKKWTTYDTSVENIELIMSEFQIPEIIARALINRGINTVPKVEAFLNNDLSYLHDPYLMRGMEQAVKRILDAIKQKDKICVYGDYDVDGITSTVVMIRTLKELGSDAVYYIPNRIEEGYGLSISSMDRIKELGVSLIVTVDCGIRSIEVVDYAQSLGMEVIVTDHHECEGELPKALSIVNPHQPGCGYPHKELAGVGVAYKLASALLSMEKNNAFAEELLDIVSMGTIADVVPLLDENRIIVKNGLKRIKNTSNEGIKALLEVCGLSGKELSAYNVAFMLAPRINAAGRIADASECVELLLTDNAVRAKEIAEKLDTDNRERQAIENEILNSAITIIEQTVDIDKDRVLVLGNENWHVGVIGIVASRLVDRFNLPTFIMSVDGELSKGSARSIRGFNLFEAMSRHSGLFEKYGGHEMAAGFTIKTERMNKLRESMNFEAESVMGKEKILPELLVDYKLMPGDISLDTVKQLKVLEPFGIGNPSPLYVYRGLKVLSSRAVGNESKHLSLTVY
ncbi:MAG TPA: single-stranded-DNA-specific exonuclease RecJ, partial [Patescibacteria group bacterium]|nr:single-stranded-DNA-specific exonuclease RecJ [Patescibacteria group bacterium]